MTKNDKLVGRAKAILKNVDLPEYTFTVRKAHGGVVLYAEYMEPDTYTGVPELQQTRKWVLSPHMTKSEIVQTAFKCAHTSFEHRVREGFKYKGKRVFSPHFDIEDLAKLRDNAGGR